MAEKVPESAPPMKDEEENGDNDNSDDNQDKLEKEAAEFVRQELRDQYLFSLCKPLRVPVKKPCKYQNLDENHSVRQNMLYDCVARLEELWDMIDSTMSSLEPQLCIKDECDTIKSEQSQNDSKMDESHSTWISVKPTKMQ